MGYRLELTCAGAGVHRTQLESLMIPGMVAVCPNLVLTSIRSDHNLRQARKIIVDRRVKSTSSLKEIEMVHRSSLGSRLALIALVSSQAFAGGGGSKSSSAGNATEAVLGKIVETLDSCIEASHDSFGEEVKCFAEAAKSYQEAGFPAGWKDYTGEDYNKCSSQCQDTYKYQNDNCGKDQSCKTDARKDRDGCYSRCERVERTDKIPSVSAHFGSKKSGCSVQ